MFYNHVQQHFDLRKVVTHIEKVMNDKTLLQINELCAYLGIGETKARELLKLPRNGFSLKIGAKWYAHKERLDSWLLEQCDKY
ncbi:helix-turn-helix domain-containing protein [Anaerotignum sp.]|uniref:helix-turn-helix domain-containing protein n=1 Tax=Anaerotignum sp. TaxID=2039241 RepID=UPI0028997844|nr:helix-turn-helix domain-containing protein [Anaerotignum sp.]